MAIIPQTHNAEDVILDHLVLFHQQTWAVGDSTYHIKTVLKNPPDTMLDEMLPLAYFLVGGMNTSLPQDSTNSYILDRNYTVRLLLTPFKAGIEDNVGTHIQTLNRSWVSAFRVLYMGNTRLEIRSNPDYRKGLPNIFTGFNYRDGGIKPIQNAPSGSGYWGIDFDLDIPIQIYSQRVLS